VGREDDALRAARRRAQPAQALAQGAGGEHVEAVGGFVENDVGRVVDQGPRQRRLHPLALAEAFRAPVEQGAHVEHAGELSGAGFGGIACHALQGPVVDDVLASGEPGVEAARIGKHADAGQHLARPRHHVDAVDLQGARVRRDQPGEHAQRRRLAAPLGRAAR
jgi:hypothetical protein